MIQMISKMQLMLGMKQLKKS